MMLDELQVEMNIMKKTISFAAILACMITNGAMAQDTRLLWGDTHLHTSLSPDAYIMGNRSLLPDDAYRYAKGLPVVNAQTRHKIQIHTPLDFLVVSDHAEYMGIIPKLFDGDEQLTATPAGRRFSELVAAGETRKAFFELVTTANDRDPFLEFIDPAVTGDVWKGIYESAEKHYEPGAFTSFIGWEWSSITEGANLHRIVFTKDGADKASQFLPYSLFDSDKPEDLWQWLKETERRTGASFMAIPHNGNVSKGLMFSEVDSQGRPINAQYAKTRSRWEPIYEMTQIKGDGETLGDLSPNDEFAEFESYRHPMDMRPGMESIAPADQGDYARTALMRGLELANKTGVNPYSFGMIGSSDSHSGVPAVEEDNFGGKFPIDSYPEGKSSDLTPGTTGWDMSASGLAAVWAQENTREAIFDAFQRREVYATTGPRIMLRFFAGWDFEDKDLQHKDIAAVGYARGVPMGAELKASSRGSAAAPSLLIVAAKDPLDANLDRIQVVKGWLDGEGKAHEKVFNVAGSDGREVRDNQLPAVGNTVDIATAKYTNSIGEAQLATVWTDSEFDAARAAFYYVRVLQIPTPRHSLYAAVAMKRDHPASYPPSIQERAYSSPIWYSVRNVGPVRARSLK